MLTRRSLQTWLVFFLLLGFLGLGVWSFALQLASANQRDLRIYLKAGVIDSRIQNSLIIGPPFGDVTANPLSTGELFYLVQFDGPIQSEWRAALLNTGAELSGYYIPDYTFLVRLRPELVETVRALLNVYAVLDFEPAYKVDTGFLPEGETLDLNVMTFSMTDLPALENEIVGWGGTILEEVWSSPRLALIRVSLPAVTLNNLLASGYVTHVEYYDPPGPLMVDTQWINQSYLRGATPLWDRGLSGAGEIISVREATGGTPPYPYEFQYNNCFLSSTTDKVTFYGVPPAACTYSSVPPYYARQGCYHRMGVLSVAIGDSPPYSLPNPTGTYTTTYDSLAYDSRAIMASTDSSKEFPFLEYTIGQGSRIANFSYGAGPFGQYSAAAAAYDDFLWDKAALNQHMLLFISAGNDGLAPPPDNKINNLATAKNIVTVGGTERYRTSFPNHSPEDMWDQSAWGPTVDGRAKPDIVAAGEVILPSVTSGMDCAMFPDGFGTYAGTSYASPIAAGAAALIREYYLNDYYPGGVVDPSAALVKATLINSGRNMFGTLTGGDIPGDKQGWGRITLGDALRFSDEPGELQVHDDLVGLATGGQANFNISVPSDNETWELKVTLVWTDWPGAALANPALVNDLDLVVTGPSGTYLGNVFESGYSAGGGTADRLNTVEQVYLSMREEVGNLEPGTYTATVSGYNVPFGDEVEIGTTQPYAPLINLRPKLPYESFSPIVPGPDAIQLPPTPTPGPYPPYP